MCTAHCMQQQHTTRCCGCFSRLSKKQPSNSSSIPLGAKQTNKHACLVVVVAQQLRCKVKQGADAVPAQRARLHACLQQTRAHERAGRVVLLSGWRRRAGGNSSGGLRCCCKAVTACTAPAAGPGRIAWSLFVPAAAPAACPNPWSPCCEEDRASRPNGGGRAGAAAAAATKMPYSDIVR